MTDDEMYDKLSEKLQKVPLEHALACEIMERIQDTGKLHGEIKKLWGALMVLGILIALLAAIGCASPEVNKCTYICPKGNPPNDCYCLEDEIKREASSIHH